MAMATVVVRNANEAMVGFGGSLQSGGRFCVGAFGRNLASVAVKMFSHLIYFTKQFYKFCTFNAICKDNAALNCITVQHKEVQFLSTLTGHKPVNLILSLLKQKESTAQVKLNYRQ
jgi:hypothetical protein